LLSTEPVWKCAAGAICAKCVESVLRQSPKGTCATCGHGGKQVDSENSTRIWCHRDNDFCLEATFADACCPRWIAKKDWAYAAAAEIGGMAGTSYVPVFRDDVARIIRKHAPKEAK
jgi:hypothetical protein